MHCGLFIHSSLVFLRVWFMTGTNVTTRQANLGHCLEGTSSTVLGAMSITQSIENWRKAEQHLFSPLTTIHMKKKKKVYSEGRETDADLPARSPIAPVARTGPKPGA